MKTWKSILSAALAGIMILSTVVGVGAANVSFTDISSHWAKPQINYLVSKDVLNGYKQNNGTYIFKPDGTVTRAEFVKMLDETFGLTATAGINFSDVKTTDWFHPYFSKAAAQGYLLNYGSSVSPNSQLTREEATTLLVRYLGLLDEQKAAAITFSDYSQISDNFKDPVMIAVKAGLINGYEEKGVTYFHPKKTLTRAEALTILYRAAGAIYNTSAYSKDASAPATNATITKGGVTLSGLNLNGRTIITEGVAGADVNLTDCHATGNVDVRGTSNLILSGCSIDTLTVDSAAPITIELRSNTKINTLIMDSKANMNIASGCSVENMIVNNEAKNVDIRGNGSIGVLTVNAGGFVSTMVPGEFYIAHGLYATFGGEALTGSSNDQAAFSVIPFLTSDDTNCYLNLTSDMAGQVYYYYSNTSYSPTANDYKTMYDNATYNGSFSVTANKSYSQKTESENLVKNYKYVVIQLVSGQRAYAPVVIDNAPTSGTGFTVNPYYDGSDISFTAEVSGTINYYYSSNGEEVTITDFQDGYRNADSAMKGTLSATANRSGHITLTDRYLDNYPFIVIVLQTPAGQYYNPVVVAAGDNGFAEEPAITTVGTIEFKTNTDGTLYYYYTVDETLPTPNEVANSWRVEKGRSSLQVSANRKGTITYDKNYAAEYPYMVFCIKDKDDNYLTPYLLHVNMDTGFEVDPYVSATDEISFKPKYSGYVYWFFTKSANGITAADFMDEYNQTTSARRGRVSSLSKNSYSKFEFDFGYTQQYPYIALMLVDTNDKQYQPVLVDVKNTTNTGFLVEPTCDLASEQVQFKAIEAGEIYYYFSKSTYSYNETVAQFWQSYENTSSYYREHADVPDTMDYFTFGHVSTDDYPGVMVLYVDKSGREYYPVYVPLTRDGSVGASKTGVTLLSVTKDKITLYIEADGTLYYNGYNSKNDYDITRSKSVSRGNTVVISNSGYYTSMEIELDGYEPFFVDLTENYNREDLFNDGSNTSGYGFSSVDISQEAGYVIFVGVAVDDGTVTFSSTGVVGENDTVTVKKGEPFMYTFKYNLDNLDDNPIHNIILGSLSMSAQFTSASGNVYERYPVFKK